MQTWSRKPKFEMHNHIFLMLDYIEKLKDLTMIQRWIELSKKDHVGDQRVLAVLERKSTELTLEKIKLQDEMFEISRSN